MRILFVHDLKSSLNYMYSRSSAMVEQFRMSLRGPVAAAAPGRRWARRRPGTRAPGGRGVPWAPWQLRAARYTTFPEVTRKGPPRDLRGADNSALGFVSWILRTQKGLSSQSPGELGVPRGCRREGQRAASRPTTQRGGRGDVSLPPFLLSETPKMLVLHLTERSTMAGMRKV